MAKPPRCESIDLLDFPLQVEAWGYGIELRRREGPQASAASPGDCCTAGKRRARTSGAKRSAGTPSPAVVAAGLYRPAEGSAAGPGRSGRRLAVTCPLGFLAERSSREFSYPSVLETAKHSRAKARVGADARRRGTTILYPRSDLRTALPQSTTGENAVDKKSTSTATREGQASNLKWALKRQMSLCLTDGGAVKTSTAAVVAKTKVFLPPRCDLAATPISPPPSGLRRAHLSYLQTGGQLVHSTGGTKLYATASRAAGSATS